MLERHPKILVLAWRPTDPRSPRNVVALGALALLLLATASAGATAKHSRPAVLAAPAPYSPRVVGHPFLGSVGIKETTATIMAREAFRAGGRVEPRLVPEFEGPDRRRLPQNRASQALSSFPKLGRNGALALLRNATPLSAQSIGTSFTAATLLGVNATGAFPPDCMGAVGPTQFVVMVNNRIVSFNKTTGTPDGVLNTTTNTFFNSVRSASSTSDPRIRYDRLSGRWFLLIITVTTPNKILLAVSDAASAGVLTNGTVWTYYSIPIATTPPAISTTCLMDYPTLGIDANALYVGGNNFCGSPQTFNSTDGWVVRKSSVLAGGPIVVTVFRGLVANVNSAGPYTPQGVDDDDPNATEGYFIGVDAQTYGTLVMRRVSTPGGTPSISSNLFCTVPATGAPLTVPHLGNTGGTNGFLDALDDRLFAAHLRNGKLWTAHNVGVNNTGAASGTVTRNGARWYQLAVPTGSGSPTLVQSGTVFTATGTNLTDQRSYWIPSIMVSGQGHAAMAMSAAGTNEHANMAVAGRLAGDAAGTMQAPSLVTSSTTAYNPSGDTGSRGSRRWGDYSFVSLDPRDDMTMWAVHMFCDATDSYGVRVAKLIAPPPATPAALADVTAGQAGVVVTLTGTSASGSGFYDPGADLAGVPAFLHLAAAASAGAATGTPPVVTAVSYVNPTTLQLTLDATSATPNLSGQKYTLTVTNPDGQSAAAAVLHVVAPPTISLATGPSQVEGDGGTSTFDFTVNVSPTSATPVTVSYQTSDGTATVADGDYQPVATFLTIPANTASATIGIAVNGDTKHEGNETFGLTLTGATHATLGAPVTATATILNDDTPPTLAVADAAVAEGDSATTTASFAVTLSNATDQPVSVDYQTTDGTALVSDSDYVAAQGTLTIPAGATGGAIGVTIKGDRKAEPDETFTLDLANPVNATIADGHAVGTILNDDEVVPPSVHVDDPNAGGTMLPIGETYALRWTATDSSGVSGVDLLLSRDDGASYDTLAAGIANTGHFDWLVTPPATDGASAVLRVVAHDPQGNSAQDASDQPFAIGAPAASVPLGAVTEFALSPVRPNPSRGTVHVDYALPRAARVRLDVIDLAGRHVLSLVDAWREPGRYTTSWSSRDTRIAAGLYFVRFEAPGRTFVRRFAFVH